jgi:predicted RNase H-like nuclease (RuvC/YqgF family)
MKSKTDLILKDFEECKRDLERYVAHNDKLSREVIEGNRKCEELQSKLRAAHGELQVMEESFK